MNAVTLRDLLADAAQQLIPVSDTPRLDAEILLAAALDQPRSYLFTWPERLPEPEQAARFAVWLQRRLTGEPPAYLLGRREFWSLELDGRQFVYELARPNRLFRVAFDLETPAGAQPPS